MKEEIKTLVTFTVTQKFQFICKTILSYCLKCRKNSKQPKVKKIKKEVKCFHQTVPFVAVNSEIY